MEGKSAQEAKITAVVKRRIFSAFVMVIKTLVGQKKSLKKWLSNEHIQRKLRGRGKKSAPATSERIVKPNPLTRIELRLKSAH